MKDMAPEIILMKDMVPEDIILEIRKNWNDKVYKQLQNTQSNKKMSCN